MDEISNICSNFELNVHVEQREFGWCSGRSLDIVVVEEFGL